MIDVLESDTQEVGAAVVLLAYRLRLSGVSIEVMSIESGTSEESLKKLIQTHGRPNHRYLATNKTLRALYEYFVSDQFPHHDFVVEQSRLFAKLRGDGLSLRRDEESPMQQKVAEIGYSLVLSLLEIDRGTTGILKDLFGEFICFRQANKAGRVVVSEVSIRKRAGESGVVVFLHRRVSSQKDEWFGDGLVIPVGERAYLVGDIRAESGVKNRSRSSSLQGIELMVFRISPSNIVGGTTLTSAFDGEIVSTNACLVRKEYFETIFDGDYLNLIGVHDMIELFNSIRDHSAIYEVCFSELGDAGLVHSPRGW